MGYYRHGPPPGGYGVRVGVPPVTPMVKRLILINVAIWAVQFLAYQGFGNFALQRWFGLNLQEGVLRGFVWQPFSYFWLHDPSGIWHILFNMLMLWMFGGDLERSWGSRAFLRYYLVCGIGAGLFIMIGNLVQPFGVPTLGASGAIYGLLLAYGVVFAERTVLFMMLFPMKARTLAIVFFVISFFSLFQREGSVSHIAHLGGAIVGLVYLKRLWNVRRWVADLRWKLKRRQFKVVDRDEDRWIH